MTEKQNEQIEIPSFNLHDERFQWFAVICQSGMEKKAKEGLLERIKKLNLEDQFGEILIPTKQVDVVDSTGKKRRKETKMTPGYILIQMVINSVNFNAVKNTPRVSGFLGATMSKMPPPIPPMEVDRMINQVQEVTEEKAIENVLFVIGDRVKVVDGPFAGFAGEVDEVRSDKKKLRVLISVFGRPTPVDLDFYMVERTQA